jgi:hypothetical protein
LGIGAECLPLIAVAVDRGLLQVDSSPLLADAVRILAAAAKTELAALRNILSFAFD